MSCNGPADLVAAVSLSDLNLSQRVILGKSWSKHPSVWRRTHTMTQCWTMRLTLGVADEARAAARPAQQREDATVLLTWGFKYLLPRIKSTGIPAGGGGGGGVGGSAAGGGAGAGGGGMPKSGSVAVSKAAQSPHPSLRRPLLPSP